MRKDKQLEKVIQTVEKKNSKSRKTTKDDENSNRRAADWNCRPASVRRKLEMEQTPEEQKRRKVEEDINLKNALNNSKNG